MTTDRARLRQELRTHRRAISAQQRIAAADTLADHLLTLAFAPDSGYVAGYWAMDGEIALHRWQLQLPDQAIYCLPVLHDDNLLRFAPWRPGDALTTNRFGIPEPDVQSASALPPEAMSLVVMPLVGFDATGHRLGMGGGWYDRSLSFRRDTSAPPWLVGAGFDVQRVEVLQHEAWDVPLDAVCSEAATHLAEQVA